jgi:hypothetical protein
MLYKALGRLRDAGLLDARWKTLTQGPTTAVRDGVSTRSQALDRRRWRCGASRRRPPSGSDPQGGPNMNLTDTAATFATWWLNTYTRGALSRLRLDVGTRSHPISTNSGPRPHHAVSAAP